MTTLIVPIRASNAYVGAAKQSVSGTAVAPTYFFWWMDGTKLEFDLKTEEIKENDASRHLSQIIKNMQSCKIHLVTDVRPAQLGFLEEAAMGIGSDTVTAATLATTTSAAITGNSSTSATLTSVSGLPGSGTVSLVFDPGLSTEEIVPFSLPAVGSVLTVAASYNGGKFLLSHTNGATARTSTLHTLTDQNDGEYFSFEFGLGSLYSGAGMTLRIRDCKVDQIKRTAKAGTLLTYEIDLIGLVTLVQNSPATVTMDTVHHPFLFTQGVWTIDGSAGGDAVNVQEFSITQKNNDDLVQTEALTGAAIIFGALGIDVEYTVVYTSTNKAFLIYFGSATGTTDSQILFTGSLTLIFTQPDGFHSLTYTIPTIGYIKFGLPEPKSDGKAFTNQIQGTATSNMGVNTYIMSTAVACTTTTTF